MGKVEQYRKVLQGLANWDEFLLQESNLPGPRANLELAYAVAHEGTAELFERYASLDADSAPANSRDEFLAFCGTLGMGYQVAAGEVHHLARLRNLASDPRWRIREAVALGLQQWGKADMDSLITEMRAWAEGNLLEQRAVVAALCEPDLLRNPDQTRMVFDLLDKITTKISKADDQKSEGFRVLRKSLGYGWSVAVAAQPEMGKRRMEKWFRVEDKTIRSIMRENLKKRRLARMDEAWAKEIVRTLG